MLRKEQENTTEAFKGEDQLLIFFFSMRQMLKKCWEQNVDVNDLFIGFQAAYDSVWKKEIWSEMY